MKGRLYLVIFALIVCGTMAHGQYKPPSARKSNSSAKGSPFSLDRFYFGGGGGFSGGTDYVSISVSPIIGYKITEPFSAGLSLSYQYVKSGDFRFNYYGVGPFLRYNFSENIFAYTEFEYLNFEYPTLGGDSERDGFTSWFVGIGYSEPIGGNFSFNVFALYNVLYSDGSNTPYQSPLVFRVGIVGGL